MVESLHVLHALAKGGLHIRGMSTLSIGGVHTEEVYFGESCLLMKCLSVCQSVHPLLALSIHSSFSPFFSVFRFLPLSVCLPACLSVCLSVCLLVSQSASKGLTALISLTLGSTSIQPYHSNDGFFHIVLQCLVVNCLE